MEYSKLCGNGNRMTPITLAEYINAELDRLYLSATKAMFEQIYALSRGNGSQMQTALHELDSEADKLQEEEQPMKADNAVLKKSLSANNDQLKATQGMIIANSPIIQGGGQSLASPAVAAKVFTGIATSIIASGGNPLAKTAVFKEALNQAGIAWIFPDVTAFTGNYTATDAWKSRMNGWGDGYADIIDKTVIHGLEKGWSPVRTAREVRKLAEGIPLNASENITRTLQLTAYRDASAAVELINGQFIEKKIRIATLDQRTCSACIALHGTELAIGEAPDDHFRGRCDSILIPVGGSMPEMMQADSKPGQRNFVKWQTGEEWFAGLPESRQASQASFMKSPGKFNAYKSGVPLKSFVGHHQDSIFGDQIVEDSLVKSIGDEAEKFYVSNQEKE